MYANKRRWRRKVNPACSKFTFGVWFSVDDPINKLVLETLRQNQEIDIKKLVLGEFLDFFANE